MSPSPNIGGDVSPLSHRDRRLWLLPLARDAQAKLALTVAQCLSMHLCVHLCVCPRQLESRVCTQHCASRAMSTTGLFQCLSFHFHLKHFQLFLVFSRPYWVARSRLWYDVLSVCRLSVCNVLYCG